MALSHPTRVRGLKFPPRHPDDQVQNVAPHTGAWIEIEMLLGTKDTGTLSHPTRVRGL